MPYLPEKPFNPAVSRVPNLGPSSGDPKALRDPHSMASIGSKLQAMTDQAAADRLYDAPVPTTEGFTYQRAYSMTDIVTVGLVIAGVVLLYKAMR